MRSSSSPDPNLVEGANWLNRADPECRIQHLKAGRSGSHTRLDARLAFQVKTSYVSRWVKQLLQPPAAFQGSGKLYFFQCIAFHRNRSFKTRALAAYMLDKSLQLCLSA